MSRAVTSTHRARVTALGALISLGALVAGCNGAPAAQAPASIAPGTGGRSSAPTSSGPPASTTSPAPLPSSVSALLRAPLLPGMPAYPDPHDIYAADRPGALAPAARAAKPLVYVPDGISDRVDVINPATYRIVASFPVGMLPQHVVPSYDLKTLWVTDDKSNDLIAIDPRTGKPGRRVPVADPYNMYFTPNGRYAMVMAERLQRIDFRDAHTMRLHKALHVGCKGVDHGDFSANGRIFVASCEFAGEMVVVDVAREKVLRYIRLGSGYMPQDVKLSPDGTTFYVADMKLGGVWLIDARTLQVTGHLLTGRGAHGLYVSRDDTTLYITNRDEGSISLLDLATRKLRGKWQLPPSPDGRPASPDMGNVDASGRVLWLSGRYSSEVYAIDTRTGKLLARIHTGVGPHGLCVWPQPGRYSLGHTGILR